MTLRARLVLALGTLLVCGLVIFGVVTTATYANAQYNRLDSRLRSTMPVLVRSLHEAENHGADNDDGAGHTEGRGGPARGSDADLAVVGAVGTYAELRANDGTIIRSLPTPGSTARPAVPDDLPRLGVLVTVDSAVGSGEWRLLTAADDRSGQIVVAALPTGEVSRSVRRLLAIEAAASIGLLAALTAGAWLILRRGLRPLETMAVAAGEITEEIGTGELSQRVSPADRQSEVGQLGLALNTMLERIDAAFVERDQTEAKLRQFLADASHELRTPLTSIQGFAELFRLGTDNPDLDLPVVMRRIEQESARMRGLVDDLLLLARLDQTRPLESRAVDLAVLAADACTDAIARDRTRPITLDAPEPAVIAGDEGHLRQAIANLVTNALAHTPPGTPIDVGVRRADGGAVLVTVADRGPGLPPQELEHVFDRFWQADPSRQGSGSGLGLSIVAAVAHEHGGRASVVNREGGGAIFTIALPAAAASAA